MYTHSLRSSVVTGSFTLPIMMVITLVLWLAPDISEWQLWAGLGMTGLTAYLLMELNNRNALLRIRSRLMSTTYLAMMLACPALHEWSINMIPVLCYVVSYFLLFGSYQRTRAEGHVFHVFLFAGIASLFFPPFLVLILGYCLSMIFQLRNFTPRTFMAGLLGLIVPYWFVAASAIWQNKLDSAFLYLLDWFTPSLPDYSQITLPQLITVGMILFWAVVSVMHFFHTAYNDKIRTRMLFYVLATQEFILLAGMLLLPSHFDEQLRLIIVNSSAFISHYYALARGRFFNIWFNVSLCLLVLLTIFNYLCQYGWLEHLNASRPLLGITLW